MPSPSLTTTEQQILDIQGMPFKYQGAREALIRDELGLTATHFYQLLNMIIDTEPAMAYNPMLVKRLRARRVSRGTRRRLVA